MGLGKELFKIEFDKEDIQDMKQIDGVIAILYFCYTIILIICFSLIMFKTDIYINLAKNFTKMEMFRFIFYIPITVLSILPAMLITYYRKQRFSSLGIRRTKIIKSILLGILFSLPALIPSIIHGVSNNYSLRSIESLAWDFLFYMICIGLVEEIIFRSFIQTRIMGIINNKWMSIFFVGFLFAVIHLPFQMMKPDPSYPSLIFLTLMHVYFVYLYTRDNNIIGPVVAHTIFNFSGYLFI